MIDLNTLDCCGIKEIVDIDEYRNEPEQIISNLCQDYYDNEHKCAFYLFSDIKRKTAAKNLKTYILKHKLGTVTLSPTKINPNSDNSLKVYIWAINKTNFWAYYCKHPNKNNLY